MIDIKNFFINTPQFLCIVIIVSLAIKCSLLAVLAPHRSRTKSINRSLVLLLGIIIGSMAGEIVWVLKLARILLFPSMPYSVIIFSVRLAWAFLIIQYVALGLFLESLTERIFHLNVIQKIVIVLSSSEVFYFLYLAFFSSDLVNEEERRVALSTESALTPYLEITIMRHTVLYILPLLMIPSLVRAIRRLNCPTLPKILRHQLSTILKYLMGPYLLSQLLLAVHFEFKALKMYTYANVSVSSFLLTYIVYYCIRRVMGMRFLNSASHVQAPQSFNFIDDFKSILEQLSSATSLQELGQITTTFFKESCNISPRKVSLNVLEQGVIESVTRPTELDTAVELFLKKNDTEQPSLHHIKIVMYDELAFSNFYHEDATQKNMLFFLDTLNADIFLPIFSKNRLIAYIIVEKNARPYHLYSNIERDEMLVFASYLANIINLLQNKNLESLLLQQHELKNELLCRYQEINHFKESIRSFLKNDEHHDIGIIFYKHRRFIFANQSAKKFIAINPDIQEGHLLARILRTIAHQVEEYKTPQSVLTKNSDGTRLVIAGFPHLEHNSVIITVSCPNVADIIHKQISYLKNPMSWDYLLYLETTKPGHLLNQLIPCSSETFLNIKIALLQAALTPKALLLEMHRDDLISVVEVLHHINGREQLHIVRLQNPMQSNEMGIKIFGTTAPYQGTFEQKSLLEKLENGGTLFIQNIEYLDGESQEHLAEYMQYGLYRPLKSEHRRSSAARIMCSTERNLTTAMQEGNFSLTLLTVLKKLIVTIPSLLTIPEHELAELADGFAELIIQKDDFKSLLTLHDKDKMRLIATRPVSLNALKNRVQQLLHKKTKKNNIEPYALDSGYDVTDPELVQAARLGRHALRDHKIMVTLWNKFKNQNKIATFLGVNRSSVNRRCKEFNVDST